jgi:hypothetical protein
VALSTRNVSLSLSYTVPKTVIIIKAKDPPPSDIGNLRRFWLFCLDGVPGENHRPVASQRQSLLHNVVSSTPRHERDSNRER